MTRVSLFIVLALCGCVDLPDAPTPRPMGPAKPRMATELLRAHNALRAQHGLPPYTLNAQLCRSAQTHADWMAAHGHLTHGGDTDPFRRMQAAGYSYSAAGENIAWNQQSVDEVMRAWMSDWGHKHNVLGPYKEMGAAVAYGHNNDPYWVCDFGTR